MSLSLLLIVLLGLAMWRQERMFRTWQRQSLRTQATNDLRTKLLVSSFTNTLSQLTQETTKQQLPLVQLADKAMALVASADSLVFQAVQAMEPTTTGYDAPDFDPSDDGEIARIARRNPDLQGDDLSGFEKGILGELGIDPEFIFGGEPDQV